MVDGRTRTGKVVNQLKNNNPQRDYGESKTPIASGIYLPNYSVVKGTDKIDARFQTVDTKSIYDSSDSILLIDCNAQYAGSCAPAADSTYTMGSNTLRWSIIYGDNLKIGNTSVIGASSIIADFVSGYINFSTNDILLSGSIKDTGSGGFDIYPENQTTIGLRISEDGSNLELSGLGTSNIEILDNVVMGASSLTINSVEIVGTDGEVNAAAIEDKFLRNDAADTGVGLTLTGDNTSTDTAYVPMVLFNTDATPPTASNFPKGTIYVQYTA